MASVLMPTTRMSIPEERPPFFSSVSPCRLGMVELEVIVVVSVIPADPFCWLPAVSAFKTEVVLSSGLL